MHGRNQETQTSMQENVQSFVAKYPSNKQEIYEYIDFPGHESLNFRLIRYFRNLKALLFMIDGGIFYNNGTHETFNNQKSIAKCAQLLFNNLLTCKEFYENHPKILIVVNKNDRTSGDLHLEERIMQLLLKEFNTLSKTIDLDEEVNEGMIDIRSEAGLGKNEDLTWDNIPYDIRFVSVSVLVKKIEPIAEFLDAL